ncbi:DNA polymerase I [Methylophaga sp.]|uniref:DNA polymerase I n=1 Tax=Methylophaga sp. TaxID=2024840 RepID=UPI0014014B2C|nr:DNA polymerase I [Methylophaga sp.]MTI63676.1 DNA polymerase I [Methylophaga sp.]
MTQSVPLVLVDGSSYLYRAYHAMYKADLRNSAGEPTGAIRGVTAMLRRLLADYPDSHIAVVFDAKGKTFRDDIYEQYKANRPPMPDDLRPQVEPIYDIIRAMGLPLLCVDGVEADDVIGTLAKQATEKGMDVVVSTGDKDMAQLVNHHVTLVNTMTETKLDIDGVKEKFGLPPEHIIDFLALMGDKVDNIPGVPGIGEKTALSLLQKMGNLKAIYANLEAVRELDFRGAKKMPEKLAENKALAELSYELATIKCDVDLDIEVEELKHQPQDREALLTLFKQFEFRSWISELESGSPDQTVTAGSAVVKNDISNQQDYQCILNKADWQTWLKKLQDADLFAFDTETTSLVYLDARIVGVSFAVKPGEAAYLPLKHDYAGAPEQLDYDEVMQDLKPLLEDPNKLKVGQNLKYDRHVLLNHGIDLRGIAHDTMLESYVLDSTATRHDMDSLAKKYLDRDTIHFEDIAGKGKKQLTFNQIGIEEAAPYAAEDADITLQLHHVLWPKMQAIPPLVKVYSELEMPLLPVLNTLERNGVNIDIWMLQQQSDDMARQIAELEKQAHEAAGQVFNLGSPKQLQEILYDKQNLPVKKKTPKGAPSTAEEVLQELADEGYELPQIIMNYRGLSKLKSTYTDKLPLMVNKTTGRVHTSYHQAVTATGRLSSSDPNLQNIPIRSENGRRIREAFVASDGYVLLAADYSQIELRIMAHLSGDKSLLQAFAKGEDIHRHTASEIFGIGLDEVSSDQRRSAKAINFGLIYGMSAHGLSKQLGIDRAQAADYMNTYFERYPGVRNYMDNTREQAKKQGYVETIFGRRLYLPEINSSNGMRRQYAERTAINAPMQGSAADIIKRAMIDIHSWLCGVDTGIRMIMQVHDELVFEVPKDQLDMAKTTIEQFMMNAADLKVPLEVGLGSGDNWEQAH